MAIDPEEWRRIVRAQHATSSLMSGEHIEYRTIEQDAAWAQLRTWLREKVETEEERNSQLVNDLRRSGDYSHEGLVKLKTYIDISSAQLLVLHEIERKVLSYTGETDCV